MVYPFNGNLNNKKARTTDWCLNIGKPKICFSKENVLNPKGYILYNIIHMKFYEKLTVVMGNRWAFARDSREARGWLQSSCRLVMELFCMLIGGWLWWWSQNSSLVTAIELTPCFICKSILQRGRTFICYPYN